MMNKILNPIIFACIISGCSTVKPGQSFISENVSVNDLTVVSTDIANYLPGSLSPAKTTLIIDGKTTDVSMSVVQNYLRYAGYGVRIVDFDENKLPPSEGVKFRYVITEMGGGVLLRMQFLGGEITRFYSRDYDSKLKPSGAFTVRYGANSELYFLHAKKSPSISADEFKKAVSDLSQLKNRESIKLNYGKPSGAVHKASLPSKSNDSKKSAPKNDDLSYRTQIKVSSEVISKKANNNVANEKLNGVVPESVLVTTKTNESTKAQSKVKLDSDQAKPINKVISDNQAKIWRAESGETLRTVLERWSSTEICKNDKKEHWTVLWSPDIDYPIDAPLTFSSSYVGAVTDLFGLYKHADVPLYVGLFSPKESPCVAYVTDNPSELPESQKNK